MRAVWAKEIRAEKNHTLGFVKAVTPEAGDKIRLAASSVYRFFVNGELIGYGPARACHGYTRVDEYDLSAYAGKETYLAFEVFAANINTYYVLDELPFFAAEIVRGKKVIAEAKDFAAYRLTDRVQKVQKFSFQRAFVEVYDMKQDRRAFYLGDTTVFPAVETSRVSMNKLLNRYVPYPALPFSPYTEIVECGKVTFDSGKTIYADDRTFTKIGRNVKGFVYEELEDKLSDRVSMLSFKASEEKKTALADGEYMTVNFGRTHTGFVTMELEVKRNAVIYLTFDEVISPAEDHQHVNPFRNDCTNAIKYTLAAGRYHLLAAEPNSMHYTTVSVTEGEVAIEKFGIVDYENPEVMAYDKKTGDEDVDVVVEAGRNTLAQNAVDVLTDCPSRERAGWLCDSYFSGRSEAFFTGDSKVEKSFIENYLISPQLKELGRGMLPMCYPADHYDHNFIPQWAMWFVLEYKNYLDRTGDKSLFLTAKRRFYNLMKYFKKFINSDGLLENLEGWNFVEWSRCNDAGYIDGVNYPTNMLYAATVEAIGEMYGDKKLIEQANKMRAVIREQSFNGEYFEENRHRDAEGNLVLLDHVTETCQYYAFYFKTATKEDYPALFKTMMEDYGPMRDAEKVHPTVSRSNAIVGNSLRFEIMEADNENERILKEGRYYFVPMAKLTGTLWEHNAPEFSLNHAFASYAASFMTKALAKSKQ